MSLLGKLFNNKKKQNVFVANFLDPMQGLNFFEMMDGEEGKGLCYKEEIVARNEQEYEYYSSRVDKRTNELYFMIVYKNGEKETFCCDKNTFDNAYNKMLNV